MARALARRAGSALLLAVATAQTEIPASLSCGPSLCFASSVSSGMVLQQAPARAALYGSAAAGSAAGSAVVVTLNSTDGSGYSGTFPTSLAADGTWKVLLDPRPAGGNLTATVACPACVNGTATATISDLTFGDVLFCSGQSNAWLPLMFTFERNETTDRVAAGFYDNIRVFRGGLGEVTIKPGTGSGNWVAPGGPEPGTDASDALTNQWRHPRDLLSPNDIRPNEPWLWEIPSTCFYTAAYLTDMLGGPSKAPPIGVLTVPVGGTMLEQWSPPEAQAACTNTTCMCSQKGCDPFQPHTPENCTRNSDLFWGNVQPFVNLTIKAHLYYQGENDLNADPGNSAQGTGYGCLLPAMVAAWRALWSAVPNTTDPLAPFGFVTLADGTDEGSPVSMRGLRWSQTANYGSVPNPALPNSFMALAHDAGDPWDAYQCGTPNACCVDDEVQLGPECVGDNRGRWDVNGTPWFMGQIHPRAKGLVGRRLAQALYATAYRPDDDTVLATGPVFTGCRLDGQSLTLSFNETLLKGGQITWSPGATVQAENTALYLLVNATLPPTAADNHHDPEGSYLGSYANGNEVGVSGWVAVTAHVVGTSQLAVDLTPLRGQTPTAVRYAEGTGARGAPFMNRMCCGPTVDVALEPCAPDSCPLHAVSAFNNLPGVPFLAEIVGGACKCLPPQVCG